MSSNWVDPGSKFRTLLTRINEIKSMLQQRKHAELAKQLGEVNDSTVVEGNHANFSDTVFKMMWYIQTAMDNGFKAMEAKVVPLEAKHAGRGENAAGHIYTIYASIWFDILKSHLPSVHTYVDDMQLYIFMYCLIPLLTPVRLRL